MRSLESFPRLSLGVFPTPIQKLENISRLLRTNVFVKRDDLSGLGLGGNKVRKLEFLLADAKEKGAEIVFTTGGAQSNHAMLTAAAAGKLGMKAVLVLKKRGVTACRGNQLLERLMGTEVRFVDTDDYADIYAEMDRLGQALGRSYYKIPCGGSNALGSLGYVACAREIAQQGTHFDHIICAEGSGGTMAGLSLGAKLFLPGTRVHGMMVDTDPFDRITPELMRAAAGLLDLLDKVSRFVSACAFVSDEDIFYILTLADTLVIDSFDALDGSLKSGIIHIRGKFHRVTGRGNESLLVTIHDSFAAELVSADFDRLHGRSRRFRQKRDRLIRHIRAVRDRNSALGNFHTESHTSRRTAFLTVLFR